MKLTQNQYYGLRSELPHSLNPGSVYLCEDTREFFIYGESGTPSELKVSNEISGVTQEDVDAAILAATNALILGTVINVVSNYNQLPIASSVAGKFYFVDSEQGTKWLPGSIGGTYYPKGLYHSTGVSWSFVESPYQATFAEVNSGINDDKFVTPYTLSNYAKWSTKYDSSNPSGYITSVPAQSFNSIINKPTTLSGYGISDAYPLNGNPSGFLTNYTETDPNVRAINGIVKSNGTTISAAVSGTDYVIPSGIVNSANTLVGLTTSIATLNNQSGVNTGNQTSIVGITGTKSQFDTAITDGNIQFVGDAPTVHNHLLANGATDVTITAANLNALDDNSNYSLHFHNSDRDRSNHTGTQAVNTITGLGTLATQSGTFSGTSSGNNTGDNATNTQYSGLITNATHTGEVTGATVLTITNNAITNEKLSQMPSNTIKGNNAGIASNAIDLTGSQVKSILAITNNDISGLGTLSTQNGTFSGSSSNTNTGDETTASIQSKRPIKTVNGSSIEGSGNIVISGGSGEVNTASNTGILGVGVFKQKTSFDLEFYKLNPVSNKISIALSGTDRIDVNVNESNFSGIPQSGVVNLTSDLSSKQNNITLTTLGTSGVSTLVGNTLNIPNYATGGGGGGVTFEEVMRIKTIFNNL